MDLGLSTSPTGVAELRRFRLPAYRSAQCEVQFPHGVSYFDRRFFGGEPGVEFAQILSFVASLRFDYSASQPITTKIRLLSALPQYILHNLKFKHSPLV